MLLPFLSESILKKIDRDEPDQRHSRTALSVFSQWSVGARSGRRGCSGGTVPQTPSPRGGSDGMRLPLDGEDATPHGWQRCWSCDTAGSPVQAPLKPVLIFPFGGFANCGDKKRKPIPCVGLLRQSLPPCLGEDLLCVQWGRSYPRLFKEN